MQCSCCQATCGERGAICHECVIGAMSEMTPRRPFVAVPITQARAELIVVEVARALGLDPSAVTEARITAAIEAVRQTLAARRRSDIEGRR